MSPRVLASTLAAAALLATSAFAQQIYRAPRTPDGKPNINGIWQAMNTADWDLRAHAASQWPLLSLGAEFSVPPGTGVIDGDGTIPYLPAAAEQQKKNFANRLTLDPEVKCYMGGVPRTTYMPYPFEIIQSSHAIMIAYEFAGAVRSIHAAAADVIGWHEGALAARMPDCLRRRSYASPLFNVKTRRQLQRLVKRLRDLGGFSPWGDSESLLRRKSNSALSW